MHQFSQPPHTQSPFDPPLAMNPNELAEMSLEEREAITKSATRALIQIDDALHGFLANLPNKLLPAYVHNYGHLARPHLPILLKSNLCPRTMHLLCEHLSRIPAPSDPVPHPVAKTPEATTSNGAAADATQRRAVNTPNKSTTRPRVTARIFAELSAEMTRILTTISHDERRRLERLMDQSTSAICEHLSDTRVNAWLTDPGPLGVFMRNAFHVLAQPGIFPKMAKCAQRYLDGGNAA